MITHPSFRRASALPEPLRAHFPKSREETLTWEPMIRSRALSTKVLAVARTRIECAWAAYVDAVPGINHRHERAAVLETGAKLDEQVARVLFPEFHDIPYAG